MKGRFQTLVRGATAWILNQKRSEADPAISMPPEGFEVQARERPQDLATINAALQKEVAERIRAEEQIRELNSRLEHRVKELQAVLDVLPVGVGIASDPECRDIRINQAFARMLDLKDNQKANASKSAPPGEAPTHFRVFIGDRETRPEDLPMQMAASQGIEIRDVEEEILFQDGRSLHALA